MKMKHSPEKLMDIHAKIQTGTYISKVIELPYKGLKFVYSESISDHYWNYAYNLKCESSDLQAVVDLIKSHTKQMHRGFTLYLSPETKPANILELITPTEIESEVWMILETQAGVLTTENAKGDVEIVLNSRPPKSFIKIFDDSYGGGEKGSAGYFGLPPEYIDSIRNSTPQEGVDVAHFIRKENSVAVAIASIFVHGEYAGLYNVGTVHAKRRMGYGSQISRRAIAFAKSKGVKYVFLQTQADSEVEKMYFKIGFRKSFVGMFVKI